MSDSAFSNLNALFINGTLKQSPRTGNTRGLMDVSAQIMEKEGVNVETIRLIDHDIPHGMKPDMTEEGYDSDDWPEIFNKIKNADILVIGSPIWMGTISGVTKKLIERLDSKSAELNEKGQSIFYGCVAGCIITGNEDGAKQCSSTILYALQHIGFTIPPQADTAWLGKVGPGPGYLDEESNAENHEFTNKNTTIMTYNLMHLSSILKSANAYPQKGNDREAWQDGDRWAFTQPQLNT